MIEVRKLTKRYGNFTAVNDVSFTIPAGEIFCFLGKNGAGKTTTIKMLAGLLQPTSGSISLGGHDMSKEPEAAKALTGYIPDRPYMYTKLTGREFLYFIGDLYSMEAALLDERADQLMEEFGLTAWQNELIDNYSHGMKQRLATCAALLPQPKILIIDEPMVGLDPHGAKMLKDSFRKYAAMGVTIFLSTHSLNVAEEVAHRLAIIQSGEIIAEGTLAELCEGKEGVADGLENLFLEITGNESRA